MNVLIKGIREIFVKLKYMRVAQKLMPYVSFSSKYLFENHENNTFK
jgi:hypothetical protein